MAGTESPILGVSRSRWIVPLPLGCWWQAGACEESCRPLRVSPLWVKRSARDQEQDIGDLGELETRKKRYERGMLSW